MVWYAIINEINYYNIVGCPAIIRCDYGTENASVATCQLAFRGGDSASFVYGPSKYNIVRYYILPIIYGIFDVVK